MNLRTFDAAVDDAIRLSQFRCSTGAPFEDEVEAWIRTDAVAWANDLPRAQFQRRTLGLTVDHEELAAVVAWQDITRVDLEGIWLEVLAVTIDHQHGGRGQGAYELTSTTSERSSATATTSRASHRTVLSLRVDPPVGDVSAHVWIGSGCARRTPTSATRSPSTSLPLGSTSASSTCCSRWRRA